MLKKYILFITMVFFAVCIKAQYPVALIPDSLKKDAKMVIRLEEEIYEIKSPGKATEKEKRVYSIMNEDGKNYADYISSYDKFTSINYIDGRLYNAEGKEIKHVKKKDMTDESGSDDETLMTDTRYKRYNMEYGTYPYTASYEEEDDIDGIFHLPYWYPQPRPGISVEVSRLVVIAPKDYVLRYKQTNFNAGPVITEQGDKKVYTWEIKNLPARQSEDYAPVWQELTPYVILEPSLFEVSGYKGDMTTWESFGKFINTLNQGKDVLPDAVKQIVHQLTDKITDQKEKIKVLYSYMQQNTRYINVSFGIGGWQPFDANYVYTKRYGDCKALSNYMVALLKEAGIKANYVLIRSGKDATPMMTDFPNPIFSHATVCVPAAKDTMWLECTSQTSPAGYIGDFTGNRKALLIDENGGHVVDTKRYTSKENKDVTTVTGEIDETGKLTATLNTSYYGYNYFSAHVRANYYSKEDQLKHLKNVINLATYDVKNFKYEDIKSDDPVVKETIEVTADGAATITGKRLFFTPNFLTQGGGKLEPSDNRKFDVVYNHDYTNIDSITFKIPIGYVVEAMAKDVSINNQFGKYDIHFKVDGDKLLVTRYHECTSGRYPPSEYNNFVKFYNDIYKADRSKIVFVKKE
jgi:transglutaminase-like putative cysteine protease